MNEQESPRVTRGDLRRFDGEAARLILWAQEQGATVKLSNKGHAIILGPNGKTASVSQKSKSNNRSSRNTQADVRRLFK